MYLEAYNTATMNKTLDQGITLFSCAQQCFKKIAQSDDTNVADAGLQVAYDIFSTITSELGEIGRTFVRMVKSILITMQIMLILTIVIALLIIWIWFGRKCFKTKRPRMRDRKKNDGMTGLRGKHGGAP